MSRCFKTPTCLSILSITFLIFLGLNQTNAQGMSIGLKDGLNLAHMSGDVHNPTFLMGDNVGFFFTYNLKKEYSFTAELLFSMKGTKYYDNDEFTHKRLNYIELPILCQYFLPIKWEDYKVKIFAGPAVSYLIYAKDHDIKVLDNYKKADLNLLGGIGFHKLCCKKMWFIFDVRYQRGLLSIIKDDDLDVYTGVLSFNVGISYPIGGKKKDKKEKEKGK